jgi:HAD superfamily 5'-nucleotidase-like hydrolase
MRRRRGLDGPARERSVAPARRDDTLPGSPPTRRRIFCNRTLNLRAISAIGYDMDYTLVQYRMAEWERCAYEHTRRRLAEQGWPVDDCVFDPELAVRGLVIDTQLGNLLKVNRFGFVKRATHGTRPLDYEEQRTVYTRIIVGLAEPRWVFLNTLFSISEAVLYAQLVEILDAGKAPAVLGYADLYRMVRSTLDHAHLEGQLKQEIVAQPERFVILDEETPLALLDQRHAGKKLLLVTNSEASYTAAMMAYTFDRFLPAGTTWRELFDVVIVAASKPAFFDAHPACFEIVTEEGLLRPASGPLRPGALYWGGNARLVEEKLGLNGDQILYVGDHLFSDVQVTKNLLRWRTGLILPELDEELQAIEGFAEQQSLLDRLMAEKEELEYRACQLRVQRLRLTHGYGPPPAVLPEAASQEAASLRTRLTALDDQIGPLARQAGEVHNRNWGLLMRAGNDKSLLARQVESYADVYMPRVSSFLHQTPFFYLRSLRGSLPHDPGGTGMELGVSDHSAD